MSKQTKRSIQNRAGVRLLVIVIFFCWSSRPAAAATITFFPASAYSTDTSVMDQRLGITGYTIEGFENTNLITGLTISYQGNGFSSTNSSLPEVLLQDPAWSFVWDGETIVSNDPSNAPPRDGTWPSLTTFTYAPGATSIGIGLGGFQSIDPPSDDFPVTNHRLYINGVALPDDLEALAGTNWIGSRLGRDVYVRIDAAADEVITSIGFENKGSDLNNGNDDVLFFDHLAVKPITNLQISNLDELHALLSWRTNATGYLLESTATLPASSWNTVTNAPVIAGDEFTVTVGRTNSQQFFRLHK